MLSLENIMEGAAGSQGQRSLKGKNLLPAQINPHLTYPDLTDGSNATSISRTLVNRVSSLPQELFDKVIDLAVREHVQPGRIHFGRKMDPRVPSALGNASKSAAFHEHARNILFAENIWVFPRGEVHEGAFLRKISPSDLATIAAMEVPLTYDDARDYHPGDSYIYRVRKANECRHDGEPVDKAAIRQDYDDEVAQWERGLAESWVKKVQEVARMKLGYLRLDFTALDVNDVGLSLARFMMTLDELEFPHGLPPHFEVVAGTKKAAACVERGMRERFTTEWTREGVCAFCEGGLH